MEFWKNDLKFRSRLYFKLLIIYLEYSNAIKKQKEEEKGKGKDYMRKRQKSDKIQELRGASTLCVPKNRIFFCIFGIYEVSKIYSQKDFMKKMPLPELQRFKDD